MLSRGGAAKVPGPGRPYVDGGSREREAHYHVGRRGVTVFVVPESRPRSFSLRSGEVSARLTPSGGFAVAPTDGPRTRSGLFGGASQVRAPRVHD